MRHKTVLHKSSTPGYVTDTQSGVASGLLGHVLNVLLNSMA